MSESGQDHYGMCKCALRLSPRSGLRLHEAGFRSHHAPSADVNMHVVLGGSIRYRWPGGTALARAGALVALPLGLALQEADGPLGSGVHLAVLHAQVSGLPPWPNQLQLQRPRRDELAGLGALGSAFAAAAEDWKGGEVLAGVEAEGLAQALLARWFRRQPGAKDAEQLWLAPLLVWIEERLGDQGWGVAELAAQARMSRAHFSRRFAAAAGSSPGRYIMQRRLRQARHLLAHGASVSQAARACGFADPYHFSRAFKARFAMPPSRWAGQGG